MKILIFFAFILAVFAGTVISQNTSTPWTEWSKKDAEKILNDSAWGQSESVGVGEPVNTAVITKTQGGGSENIQRNGENAETMGGPKPVYYRARFLTAKPVREAFARMVTLSKPDAGKDLTDQLQEFIDRDFGNYLVVALSVESSDPRIAGGVMNMLSRLNKDTLKDKVYLERKDGKRLMLMDYRSPIADIMGAKFIFERSLDGQPFLTADSDSVRFVVEISEKMKFNMRFRVAAMMYAGKLEY